MCLKQAADTQTDIRTIVMASHLLVPILWLLGQQWLFGQHDMHANAASHIWGVHVGH